MKVAVVFLAVFAFAQAADIDFNTVYHLDLDVPLVGPIPESAPVGSRIVGGTEVVPFSRLFQVALFVPTERGTGFCGGSLITTRTVLTAAHCVDRRIVNANVQVYIGAHNVRLATEQGRIEVLSNRVLIHPTWSRPLLRDDVALIILPQAVALGNRARLIPLSSSTNNHVNRLAEASGWGRDSDASTQISPVLRAVNLTIADLAHCRTHYGTSVNDNLICTSGQSSAGNRGTCQGDSGGPLVLDGQQIGIVSFGSARGCQIGLPAAFARVEKYLAWINANRV